MLTFALLLFHLFIHVQATNLSFIFVTSFGQHGVNTSGVVPAVDLALADINSHSDILPGYNMTYGKVRDSQCQYSSSLDAFFSEIQSNPVKLAVIGCGCSVATQPVAAITSYWNIPQISYLSVSPALSNRDIYKKFFRLHASDTIDYPALRSMMNHFGWKRIAVLTQNEDIFTLAELNVRKVLGKDYTVQSRVFETNSDPVTSINDLFFHEDDYRIFFLNCYSGPARKIVCMAAKMKYTYPRYAWILNSWYTSKWWTAAEDTDTVNCTDDEYEAFLEKVLIVHSLPAAADYAGPTGLGAAIVMLCSHGSEWGQGWSMEIRNGGAMWTDYTARNYKTSLRYLSEYENRCTQERYYAADDGGRAYDATWVLALALNSTMAMVTSGNINGTGCENMSGSLLPLDQFNYTNQKMGCLIQWNIQRTNFSGVTGHIQFDINGTRMLDTVLLKQYMMDSSGELVRVTFASFSVQDNYTWRFLPNHSDDTVYPDGVPPDGTPKRTIALIPMPTVAALDALATCGLIFTLTCFLFNHGCRRKRVVRLSSTNLNNAIIVGAALMYASIYTDLVRTDVVSIVKSMCALKEWLCIIGYSLCFGTVLTKMWRINVIFQNPTAQKKNVFLKDWSLMLIVVAIVGIGIVLLIIGTAISYTTESIAMEIDRENPTGISKDDGVEVEYYVLVCYKASSPAFYWRILLFVYLAILQLVGIVLAFQTRKVKFPGLNDSKFVGAIIYTSSIVLVILIMDTFLLTNYLIIYGVTYPFGIFILTTIFLSLTFIPKMVLLYRNDDSNSTTPAATSSDHDMVSPTLTSHTQESQVTSLQDTIQKMRAVISSQETEIRTLREASSLDTKVC